MGHSSRSNSIQKSKTTSLTSFQCLTITSFSFVKKNFQKIAFIVETTHFHFIVKKTDRQADRQISERY